MKKENVKKEIPLYDPYTGEANPLYEELTGKVNPLIKNKKTYELEGSGLVEYKKTNRFLVNFPKKFAIDPCYVAMTEIPALTIKNKKIFGIVYDKETSYSNFKIELREIENLSFINTLMKKMQLNEKFDLNIDIVNSKNVKLTKYEIKDCLIVGIDKVLLDYSNDSILKCVLEIKPKYLNHYYSVK